MCGHTDILGVGRLLDVAAVGHDDHGYDFGHADHQNGLYVVYVVGLHVDLLQCLCSRIFCIFIQQHFDQICLRFYSPVGVKEHIM